MLPYSSYSVAKTICSLAKGEITNLQLQKFLYLIHMFYMGRTGKPLLDEEFIAGKYGPFLKKVKSRVYMFGADRIKYDMFYKHNLIPLDDKVAYETIEYFLSNLLQRDPCYLVHMIRKKNGAWKKNYREGKQFFIRNEDIKHEYNVLYSQFKTERKYKKK